MLDRIHILEDDEVGVLRDNLDWFIDQLQVEAKHTKRGTGKEEIWRDVEILQALLKRLDQAEV